ncbi:hypothetical protein AAULR_25531 [Lacticaseibacillus rhamnosus MTCC 5462]|nr:hypothetical protein AAULR_25531 [Lacticaseibacillus rhamnosus MTCC 5462]
MNSLQIGDWVQYKGTSFPEYTGKVYQVAGIDWIGVGYVDLNVEGENAVVDSDTPSETVWKRVFSAKVTEVEKVNHG